MTYIPYFDQSIGLGLYVHVTILLPSLCFASTEYQFTVNVNDNCHTVCLLKSNLVVDCEHFESNVQEEYNFSHSFFKTLFESDFKEFS